MKLEIDFTRQDYLDFNVHHFIRTKLTRTIVVTIIGLIILLIITNKNKDHVDVKEMIILSVFYLLISFFLFYYLLNRTKKIPDENGYMLGKKAYDFGDDFIGYQDSVSSARYSWSAIKAIRESKNAFYLYLDSTVAIVIPKRYFFDKSREKEFETFVRKKVDMV